MLDVDFVHFGLLFPSIDSNNWHFKNHLKTYFIFMFTYENKTPECDTYLLGIEYYEYSWPIYIYIILA